MKQEQCYVNTVGVNQSVDIKNKYESINTNHLCNNSNSTNNNDVVVCDSLEVATPVPIFYPKSNPYKEATEKYQAAMEEYTRRVEATQSNEDVVKDALNVSDVAKDIEERVNSYENYFTQTLLPNTPFVIRLNGRNFKSYCKRMKFAQPYDPFLAGVMKDVAKSLLEHTHATCAYVLNDEITLIFKNENVAMFNSRIDKLVSTYASMASVLFARHIPKHLKLMEQETQKILDNGSHRNLSNSDFEQIEKLVRMHNLGHDKDKEKALEELEPYQNLIVNQVKDYCSGFHHLYQYCDASNQISQDLKSLNERTQELLPTFYGRAFSVPTSLEAIYTVASRQFVAIENSSLIFQNEMPDLYRFLDQYCQNYKQVGNSNGILFDDVARCLRSKFSKLDIKALDKRYYLTDNLIGKPIEIFSNRDFKNNYHNIANQSITSVYCRIKAMQGVFLFRKAVNVEIQPAIDAHYSKQPCEFSSKVLKSKDIALRIWFAKQYQEVIGRNKYNGVPLS